MSKWRKIKSAPRDGTVILAWFIGSYSEAMCVRYFEGDPWIWCGKYDKAGSINKKCVTHWMPLPEPPK